MPTPYEGRCSTIATSTIVGRVVDQWPIRFRRGSFTVKP